MDGIQTAGTVARRLAIVALLGALFAVSAMLTIYLLFRSGEVVVPNTVGMSQEEAERAIARAGLSTKLRRQHFDDEVPPGTVSVQEPGPGFPVKEGFEVKLDVSKGPDPTGREDEPTPMGGPTTPIDGPQVEEPTEKKKPKKKEDEEKKKLEEAEKKKTEDADAKPAKTGDEPAAAKPNDTAKPKPANGDAVNPGETKKGDAAKPKPKPSVPKPPPSR